MFPTLLVPCCMSFTMSFPLCCSISCPVFCLSCSFSLELSLFICTVLSTLGLQSWAVSNGGLGEAGSGSAVADYRTDPQGLCPGVLANLGPPEKSPLLQPWGWRSSHSRATVGTQSLSGLGVAADRVERNKRGVGLGRRGGVGVEWGQVCGWNRGRLTREGVEWGGAR